MARDHARIYVSIWSNEDFRDLPIAAQHMWFTLLSQPRLSYCGVLDYLPTRLAQLAAKSSVRSIQSAVNSLVAADFVSVDPETGELLIRTFVRHDGLLTQPNMTKAMAKDYEAVLSGRLQKAIEAELSRAYADDPDMKGWPALAASYPNLHAKVTRKGSRKGSANA